MLLKNCKINNEILDILIINNKIIKIGKLSEKDIKNLFQEIEIYDCKNNIILPGYIDNHAHIIGGGGEMSYSSRVPEIKLEDITKNGVTTVVGVLGTDSITKDIKSLVAKSKSLNEEGITSYCLTGAYEFPSPTLTGRIQSDIYFINEIIGLKGAISDNRCYNPTQEDLIKAISELRVAQLGSGKNGGFNIHCGWGKGNLDVLFSILNKTNIPASILRPTHITNNEKVFKQSLELAKQGSYIDITADKDIEKIYKYIKIITENNLFNKLTISSDANGSCPVWVNNKCVDIKASTMEYLHYTIMYLVKKYNIDINILSKCLTKNVADCLGLKNKGDIVVNNDADIIILDEDLYINDVIAKGKVMIKDKNIVIKGRYS